MLRTVRRGVSPLRKNLTPKDLTLRIVLWSATSSFEMKRINHQEACSLDGTCTNFAEEYFSRTRRGEIGHYHHIAGAYLLRYAQESSWREDHRRLSNGDQTFRIAGARHAQAHIAGFRGLLAAASCRMTGA